MKQGNWLNGRNSIVLVISAVDAAAAALYNK